MAINRRIESPGVQISETDLSLRPVVNTTTTIFVPGFAPKGPIEDAIKIDSLSEFEQIYGLPTNGAERYFYNSVKATLNSPADVIVSRVPYGSGYGTTITNTFGLLAYPAVYLSGGGVAINTSSQTYTQSAGTYFLGQPVHYSLNQEQYTAFLQGTLFSYADVCNRSFTSTIGSLSAAALVILNQSQTSVTPDFQGYYIGAIDNSNIDITTDYESIRQVKSVTTSAQYVATYTTVPDQRLDLQNYALSGNVVGGPADSVSEILEKSPGFTLDNTTRDFDDTIVLGIFKLRQSVNSSNVIQLAPELTESFTGSLDSYRKINSQTGGPAESFYIEDVINGQSSNIVIQVNPYLSRVQTGTGFADASGNPTVKIRVMNPSLTGSSLFTSSSSYSTTIIGTVSTGVLAANTSVNHADSLYPIGSYAAYDLTSKAIGNVPGKLGNIFENFYNSDIYPFDIAIEAGLGTVYACAKANTLSGVFDDTLYIDVNALSASQLATLPTVALDYQAVLDEFITLNQDSARKDFVILSDPLMPILVQSNSIKTIDNPDRTFSNNIAQPLINLYRKYNTSYVTTYATCVRVNDFNTNKPTWIPFSGFAAAAFANTDNDFQPWYAPAGLTRGVINNVLDIAFYPRQNQRDVLYKNSLNPVAFFPSDGFIIYGQKTLLKKPSAFDRINVRRLFLALEKAAKDTLKYFVFEPNTLLTRTRVINTLTPIFENAKNTQGVYDYLIICDERNNTPTVIDDNSLIIDIYIKPVRTAEFILCNFYATRTGVNFQEIIG